MAALAATVVVGALALVFGGGSDSKHADASAAVVPGQPTVNIISPRNGARQTSHAVVVQATVENFRLAPHQFGAQPELGEGNLRFSLNRVPDCVDPVKLLHAINSPIVERMRIMRGSRLDFISMMISSNQHPAINRATNSDDHTTATLNAGA